jgi:hypothetical protein
MRAPGGAFHHFRVAARASPRRNPAPMSRRNFNIACPIANRPRGTDRRRPAKRLI